MVEQELLGQAELDALDARARETVLDAVRFADESPMPTFADLLTDVYVSYPAEDMWPFQEVAAR